MTKKKSIMFIMFAICFMIPAMFMLSACGHSHNATAKWTSDDSCHWHICEDKNCTEQLDKAEHSWGDWTVITNSTCTEKGTKERTCGVCGHKETRELEFAQHEYTYTYNVSTCTLVAPTEDNEGAMLLKCDNCDHKEQIFVYPVISNENYSYNCTNVNNDGWKFSYVLKNEYYTNNQISDEIKNLTRRRIDIDIELLEDNSSCNLIELLETEKNDELTVSYNFTAPGRYYIAMKDSSKTKAFKTITFNTKEETTLSSMFVYNQSGAKISDDNKGTNVFTWIESYASNMISDNNSAFLIVVDVETAGTATLSITLVK